MDSDRNVGAAAPELDGWFPADGSPALGIGEGPDDPFFDAVDYAGAFAGPDDDWTEGWIETATD